MKPQIFDSRGNLVRPRIQKSAFSGYGNAYRGAGYSKARSRIPGIIADSPVELNNGTRLELSRLSRFFKKNVGMVRGVSKSLVDHSIGSGIYPIPNTGDEAIDELYLAYFHKLANACDISGRLSFWELQRARVALKFFDGDCLTLLTRNNQTGLPNFQLFKSHNCDNFEIPKSETDAWIQGVKIGKFNRPIAYRLRGKNGKFFTVPARSIIHNMMIEEPDQVRGVSALAHAIEDLSDILDTLDLEKLAVKDNARISRVITNESGEDEDMGNFPTQESTEAASGFDPDESIALEKVFGGEIPRLKIGEKLESFASARPSPAFTGFIDWIGRSVTSGCGFPYEFAWNPKGLTGPAMRFVISKVVHSTRDWQANEVKDSRPFYTYAIADGIERKEIPDHPNKFEAEWVAGVEELTIDQTRADKSDMEKIKARLLTYKRYYAKRGLYWKKELREAAAEEKFLAENGLSASTTEPTLNNQNK